MKPATSPFPFHWLSSRALVPNLTRDQLVKELDQLHQQYVTAAGKATRKISAFNERSVSAYLLYFGATNAAKWYALIPRLAPEVTQLIAQLPFCDVGSGPGIFALCWRHWRSGILSSVTPLPVPLLLIEQDLWMQRQARALLQGSEPDDFLIASSLHEFSTERLNAQRGGVLFFGHSLNEMSDEQIQQYIDQLCPQVIMCIEPGTKEVFQRIKAWRTRWAMQGFNVIYPCPNGRETCPMPEQDWCHQILSLTHDHELEQLCQVLKKDRREAPVIFHCYWRQGELSSPVERLVRNPRSLKGQWQFQYCQYDDEHQLVLKTQFFPKRGQSKPEQKSWEQLRSGDLCPDILLKK